jgi:hypothetical protein
MKIALIVLVVLGVAVGVWFLGSQEARTPENGQGEAEQKEREAELGMLESLRANSDAQTAELAAVDGSNSAGIGYRLFANGVLKHAVVATMPAPTAGNVYEGWLVQTEPLRFFSTGVMEQQEDGTWVLEHESGEEYPTYARVVITEETVVDATPERHVIEGDF